MSETWRSPFWLERIKARSGHGGFFVFVFVLVKRVKLEIPWVESESPAILLCTLFLNSYLKVLLLGYLLQPWKCNRITHLPEVQWKVLVPCIFWCSHIFVDFDKKLLETQGWSESRLCYSFVLGRLQRSTHLGCFLFEEIIFLIFVHKIQEL